MILYMYKAPGQGQITLMTKFQSSRTFVTSIIFVKFDHDTLKSKGTRDQQPFFCTFANAITLS